MFYRGDSGFRRFFYQLVHWGEEARLHWKQSILFAALLAYAVMLAYVNKL